MKQISEIASRTHTWTMEKVTLGRYRALIEHFTFNKIAGDPDTSESWKGRYTIALYGVWFDIDLCG